jgi:putative serine protease PepD
VTATWNDQPPHTPPAADPTNPVNPPTSTEPTYPADPTNPTNPTVGGSPYQWYSSSVGAPSTPPTPPSPSSPPLKRGGGVRVVLATVAIAALLGAGFGARGLIDANQVTQVVPAATNTNTAAAVSAGPSTPLVSGNDDEPVTAVAKALGPSVVQIKRADALGSGVIYDSSGLILTNAHVVDTAKTVSVQLGDGTTLDGTVLGTDTGTDVAVIRVQPTTPLTAASLATQPAEVGQLAIALGSPFGLDHSVTAGVVSAVNRPVNGESGVVASMIQTDAPINPGNSGGALANRKGEVIGLNTLIFSQSGENNGIGFAIPIDHVKTVADKIVNGDNLDRAFLGVASQPTTDGKAGAVIAQVEAGSAAAKGGLQAGDVVTAVDTTPIKQAEDLSAVIGTHGPGDQVSLTVQRNGAETKVSVTLAARPAEATPTPTTTAPTRSRTR